MLSVSYQNAYLSAIEEVEPGACQLLAQHGELVLNSGTDLNFTYDVWLMCLVAFRNYELLKSRKIQLGFQ